MASSVEKKTPSKLLMGFKGLAHIFLMLILLGSAALLWLYIEFAQNLPDPAILKQIKLQVPLSIYSREGLLMAQYGEKKRIPVTVKETPGPLIQAFLAAEDDRFFNHPGVDIIGLSRAVVRYAQSGKKKQGGSTITMQVARNFFLSHDKTFSRKIREIFLSFKIERELSKTEILELYLNKIYLGKRAYGIGAAAQVYYGKPIDQLNLAQWAMIAGLPKAPSAYNPVINPERAIIRRDYVLRRMLYLHFIDEKSYQQAVKQPVTASVHAPAIELEAPYAAETARKKIFKKYGVAAYTSGFKVFTTIDSRLQKIAQNAVQGALHQYDERHGYRMPQASSALADGVLSFTALDKELDSISPTGDTVPGIVLSTKKKSAQIYLGHDQFAEVPWKGLAWARHYRRKGRRSCAVICKGDIVRVRKDSEGNWRLAQIPAVSGALVSLDPIDGAIVALVGGYDYNYSKYNRATQAKRQPGSGFKPILYSTALMLGEDREEVAEEEVEVDEWGVKWKKGKAKREYTLATTILDAPIAIKDLSVKGGVWRPANYSHRTYGPTRLRIGLIKSRNLVAIKLMQEIGVDTVIERAKKFGLSEKQLPNGLSLALGSGYASPLQMARVYAVFANGGFLIDPFIIDRIETSSGKIVEQTVPKLACPDCEESVEPNNLIAPRALSKRVNFLMNSLLRDVVQRGTAVRAKKLGRSDLAGKTGTTNDQRDAWFNGFTPSLVTVAWVGFDSTKPLGRHETGGHAALPMWMLYMKEALEGVPEHPLVEPEGIVSTSINPATGYLSGNKGKSATMEFFREERTPKRYAPIYSGTGDSSKSRPAARKKSAKAQTEIQSLF